jgi:hypothetical protein
MCRPDRIADDTAQVSSEAGRHRQRAEDPGEDQSADR